MNQGGKAHWRARLVELITWLGTSQAAFGEVTGMSPDYVSRLLYEPGKEGGKSLGPVTMAKIREAYGLPPGWFEMPLGSAMPGRDGQEAQANTSTVDALAAVAPMVRMKWPFRLVSYQRLMGLKKALGPREGNLAISDIDKQIEGVVLKWEREVAQKKSAP